MTDRGGGFGARPRVGLLSVIVLTYNEERHIRRCLEQLDRVADQVLVVDAFSTDATRDIAEAMGARVMTHAWTNYADQLNWALENAGVTSDWVMRLDADEVLDRRLKEGLRDWLTAADPATGGFEIRRRIVFMGREIRHGGMSPMWVTRLWRRGAARCESTWMDEHMLVRDGGIGRLPGGILDVNLRSLTWWTAKHNGYASREAVDLLLRQHRGDSHGHGLDGLNRQARLKRWAKTRVYGRLPLGMRAWLYFLYRIFLRLGALDGGRGMLFHVLQGLWYRYLVDAKVLEVQRLMVERGYGIERAIREALGIALDASDHGGREPGTRPR